MRSAMNLHFLILLAVSGTSTLANDDDDDVFSLSSTTADDGQNDLRLWLTVSAKRRYLEVSWNNAPSHEDDTVLLTMQQPYTFEKVRLITEALPTDQENGFVSVSGETDFNGGYSSTTDRPLDVIPLDVVEQTTSSPENVAQNYWTCNNGRNNIVAAIKPSVSRQWYTTAVHFDFGLSRNVTTSTSCYGYWASYINGNGTILAKTCLRAYPTWMNDIKSSISDLRIRDLFIPGTHDSGSYRPNFEPTLKETIVTKYALTQDDDIRGQLMHGARYLDIRVGYYRNTHDLFFVNHGITRQRPLSEIIEQVKDFVLETNEIIIFGLKEFPVGFGKTLDVHRQLVQYLHNQFGELIVHPSATWQAHLSDIWSRKQNIILAYDKPAIVSEFSQVLFGPVDQRWGNVRTWAKLERHLRSINGFDPSKLYSRPVADMAELTPDTWGVITDKYGGLRKMADNVNWRVSQLYRDELGEQANIVAVDFIRGTSLIEVAIEWNKRKVPY